MIEEILVCLDGSSFAETILPLARGIAAAKGATLTIVRVVSDADELSAEESYMRERACLFQAQIRFVVSPDPANAIVEELKKNPYAIAAMTTHGRTAWVEAALGSVVLKVIRGAGRPVLLYRPHVGPSDPHVKITKIVVALDGSEFSEKIIPSGVEMANSLKARLTLIQVLPVSPQSPQILGQFKGDILESSYLHARAAEIKSNHRIEADWDVLHGEPGEAMCRYVNGMRDAMLAMTTHARGGLQKVFLGSVAAHCVRHAGVPMLAYWPD